jgi:hypothetical protein
VSLDFAGGDVGISAIGKSNIATAHNAISDTASSNAINATGYNSINIIVPAITGTWKIDIQNSDGTTYVDAYDGSTQLTTGNITATRTMLFKGITDEIKIVATEVGAGQVTVKYQLLNT